MTAEDARGMACRMRMTVIALIVDGPIADAGTADCFQRNTDGSGTPLPDDCS